MNNNTFVHKYIKPLVNSNDTCVDMTLGNGLDTQFLCKYAKHVYGIDISLEAINNSKLRLKDENNITFINDNHIDIDKYVKKPIKLFVFNLGYLPHSKDSNITKAEETLIAFKKAYKLLENGGYIVITFYIGHKGGKQEYYLLDSYIKENRFHIIETYRQDKLDSPITYIIKKD